MDEKSTQKSKHLVNKRDYQKIIIFEPFRANKNFKENKSGVTIKNQVI